MVVYHDVGELLGYVEYTGDAAGSATADIPTVGELVGYVEYVYEEGWQRANVGELLGYVEYVGDAAGSATADIPTVGEIIGYVEYEFTGYIPPPAVFVYGPLVWMM